MLTWATCLTMDRNPRECATASTRSRWNWRKSRKAPQFYQDAFSVLLFSRIQEKGLGSGAGTRHQRCDRVALAIPGSQEQHFRAGRILENVIGGRMPVDFVKTGPARIGPCWCAPKQKQAQFSQLFLRMVSQIFHQRRLFGDCEHHWISPPHSAYLLLTCKDVKTPEMFRGPQQFSETNWPMGSPHGAA